MLNDIIHSFVRSFFIVLVLTLSVSCSTVKYVQDNQYLLKRNTFSIVADKSDMLYLRSLAAEDYIQQRPNSTILGISKASFYREYDSLKHKGWYRFWNEKIGEKPVIIDSSMTEASRNQIAQYFSSAGYFNASVEDSLEVHGKKGIVHYKVTAGEPYRLRNVFYMIEDEFLEPIILEDTVSCLLKNGITFSSSLFEKERFRITSNLRNQGFWGFGVNYISYIVDSTVGDHQCDVRIRVKRHVKTINSEGVEVMENHPLYRISSITVNTEYNLASSDNEVYDSIVVNDIVIKYKDKLRIRPEILLQALRMSSNEFFDQQSIEKTQSSLLSLGYNANIIFTPHEKDDDILITHAISKGPQTTTTQHELSCVVQCSPNSRQSISTDFEASTTSQYFSLALSLGYTNNNTFKGGEQFNVNFRGAYEFMWDRGNRNSYEFGVSTSLVAPRFWAKISQDKASNFTAPHSKVSLSFSTQRRPDYDKSVFGGSFGYSWKIGAKSFISINPVDFYYVSVPRVDSAFLESIVNPYLKNSYTSQLLPGGSLSYVYNSNKNYSEDNFSIKIGADYSGNSARLFSLIFLEPTTEYLHDTHTSESYYNLLGIRFAQYIRASFEMTGRKNVGKSSQIAWRFLVAGGYAYGNTKSLPFERMYFAGGGNSMRGWQMRTLGPGSVYIDSLGVYPNQLGDFKLEANFEYRAHLFLGLNAALFFDLGNVWMNSQGENREEAKFRLANFYKQLGFNTGIGLRYNIADMMYLRLDWGIKLHNPNMPESHRWFTNLGISDTALHFAIGLPF